MFDDKVEITKVVWINLYIVRRKNDIRKLCCNMEAHSRHSEEKTVFDKVEIIDG